MEPVLAMSGIVGALAIGAMSPGPSFVLVARVAVAASRRDGLAAALGMGVGGVVFGGLALLGLQAVLGEVGWLYLALKLAGGLYLLYFAVRLWRGAAAPAGMKAADAPRAGGLARSFSLGLATQLSNPKTAIFYGSVFAALLPADPPPWLYLTLPPVIFAIEAGWYIVVAVAFSSERPRAAYLRSKRWIDRLAASVIGALGLKLLLEAGRPA